MSRIERRYWFKSASYLFDWVIDNVFLSETLHMTPKKHISLKEAVILSSTSNFFSKIFGTRPHRNMGYFQEKLTKFSHEAASQL